ncbi:MAG: sugar kinase, partial [Chloroflexota bacterium]
LREQKPERVIVVTQGAGVRVVVSVGEDAFGDCLRAQLREDGVDAAGLRSVPGTTGVAFVAYNANGSRDFVFSLGAGGEISPEMLEPGYFDGVRCLHLMGSTLSLNAGALQTARDALAMAQAGGLKFSFDPNLRPELLSVEAAKEAFAPFMAAADVLIPTADELVQLTGADSVAGAVASLREQKPERVIVVTQGADGCTIYDENGARHIPGFAVEEVDPTGAGDCFDAGFLVRWLAGDRVAEAARWANACGALAVTKQGPMAGAETLAVVRAFMT